MGQPTFPSPALLITAAFSRYDEALAWAKRKVGGGVGGDCDGKRAFDFHETDYYEPTMGPGIKKIFWAFEKPFDTANLVDIKLAANRFEEEYRRRGQSAGAAAAEYRSRAI